MGEFNSDDHYIYYCGEESLRRTGVAIVVNKRVQNVVLGCRLKNDRMISVHFQMHYDYTVEVTNRFYGLDLIDRVPDELWMEVHDVIQEGSCF